MKHFSFRALSEPAFGAEPVSPFPTNAAMRVSLLALFYTYVAVGWTNENSRVAAFGALPAVAMLGRADPATTGTAAIGLPCLGACDPDRCRHRWWCVPGRRFPR
jgi:hypothetical protein